MKKNLLTLVLLSCGLAGVSAQTMRNADMRAMNRVDVAKSAKVVNAPATKTAKSLAAGVIGANELYKSRKAGATRAGDEVQMEALYKLPDAALFAGVEAEGWYQRLYMYTEALDTMTFLNYSSWDESKPVYTTWYLNNRLMAQDEKGNGKATMFGSALLPILEEVQDNDTVQYSVVTYNYQGVWYGGCDTIMSLSNASPAFGVYGGFTNGPSFTANNAFYETGKKCIGFGEYYEKPQDILFVSSGYILLKRDAGTAASAPLEGKTLTFTVNRLTETGMEVVATATATDDDIAPIGTAGLYLVTFNFVEDDPVFGSVESPIVLSGDEYFVTVTGFENLAADYTALFTGAEGFDGFGYAILEDGTLGTVGYRSDPQTPQVNLHIGFNGAIPVALVADDTMMYEVPVEGGYGVTAVEEGNAYNDFAVYTLSGMDSWELVDAPDWVDNIEMDESYLSRGLILVYASGEALPEGTEGRYGTIVLSLYGKQVVLPIKQGTVDATGISNAVVSGKHNANAPVYNLGGQMVSGTAKGIKIQNGKKFIK